MTNPYKKDAVAKYLPVKLRYFRKKCGMTIYTVANAIKKTGATVSLWEKGKALPDAETLLRLCNIYNVTDINEFFCDKNPEILNNLSRDEKRLVSLYRDANKSVQISIMTLLENLKIEEMGNL